MRTGSAENLRAVAEQVSMLVHRPMARKRNAQAEDPVRRQRRELVWIRHSVVVEILPQPQVFEDYVLGVYHAIVIHLEHSERQVSLSAVTGRLRREVPKELGAVIYDAVAVAIESKPSVI